MSLNDESAVAAAIPPEEIAPDTGRRLTTAEKLRFGIGFALFSLLWMTAGTPDPAYCCRSVSTNSTSAPRK